eukprot:3225991-Rhodomonas_salina.1
MEQEERLAREATIIKEAREMRMQTREWEAKTEQASVELQQRTEVPGSGLLWVVLLGLKGSGLGYKLPRSEFRAVYSRASCERRLSLLEERKDADARLGARRDADVRVRTRMDADGVRARAGVGAAASE